MHFLTPGEKIKRLRKQLHIKQEDLNSIGVSRNFISMLENNKRKLNKENAKKLFSVFEKKALSLGIKLNIDENYLLIPPAIQARQYCESNLASKDIPQFIDELIIITKKYELLDILIDLYLKKGDILYNSGQYQLSFNNYYSALLVCQDIKQTPLIGYIYNKLGKCKIVTLCYIEAISFLNNAYHYTTIYEDKVTEKNSLYNLALSYKKLGNIDNALSYIDMCLNLCNPSVNIDNYIGAMMLKCNCYVDNKQLDLSISIYEYIINSYTNIPNELIGYLYNNLGEIYLKKDDYINSMEFFNKSLELRREYHSPNLCHTLIDKSALLIKLNDIKQATVLLEEGLQLSIKLNDIDYIIKDYYLLEEVYSLSIQSDKLECLYINIINLLNTTDKKEDILKAYIKLSLLNISKGNIEKGNFYLSESLKI